MSTILPFLQPSFGTDDRRRILDIHKERKKKRKQDKKKHNISPSRDRCRENAECDAGNNTSSISLKIKMGENGVGNTISEEEEEQHSIRADSKGPAGKRTGKDDMNISEEVSYLYHGSHDNNRQNYSQQLEANQSHARCLSKGYNIEPQQNNHQSCLSSKPPPGLEVPPDVSCIRLDNSQSIETASQAPVSEDRIDSISHTSFIKLPAADALFITVPHNERLKAALGQPEISLAVPAAHHFVSTYYSYFDFVSSGARTIDLARYYTAEAQKSVSIGGAHSVVTGRKDIATQICNFVGTSFEVRGVVAQDAADRKGVHILVTGVARTNLNGSQGGVVASFAHSISLVPMDADSISGRSCISCPALLDASVVGYPFQIHNDALALLSGDLGPTSPISSPQATYHPPPPPGLL